MQTTDVDRLLTTLGDEEANRLSQLLETRHPECEWSRELARRKAQAARERFYELASERLKKRWSETRDRIRDKVGMMEDREERSRKLADLADLTREFEGHLHQTAMTGQQLMAQLEVATAPELEDYWDKGMEVIQALANL